jgi:ketosteroid isomerase-like protein
MKSLLLIILFASAPVKTYSQTDSISIREKINQERQVSERARSSDQIVLDFVYAINDHNVDKLCSFITEDHKFIDSQGNEAVRKEQMRSGWTGYFQLFPDYKIEITAIFPSGDTIAAFGYAGGTYEGLSNRKENYWHLPAAWKAIVKDGKIQLWQVYCDSKIPFDIINKSKGQ